MPDTRVHPIVAAAGRGEPPPWTQAGPRRFAHMQRVSALLGEWAEALRLAPEDRVRWRALGLLHDALREAPPHDLQPLVPPTFAGADANLLHGPAAAERLRRDGVTDDSLLHAITHHTLGSADLDTMGRALFLADFLEPGRRYHPVLIATLRARMPHRLEHVLVEVLRFRIQRLISQTRPIRDVTISFWNAAVAASIAAGVHGSDVAASAR